MTRSRFVQVCVLVPALAGFVGGGCGDHDHDHGATASGSGTGHKHGSQRGGVAVELGEHQFQLDVVHDPAAGVLNAWVMDGHMENFVRIAAPSFAVTIRTSATTNTLALAAVANNATGEKVGDTSQFQGEAAWLKGITTFHGTVDAIEIRGRRFASVAFAYPGAGK